LRGRLPGDVRFRLRRPPRPIAVPIPKTRRRIRPLQPALLFVLGFGGLILLGALLLALPVSSQSGQWTAPLDALFTATSAVCVTGLVVVDTATHWSRFGQAVLILLMQLGGLGFMTASTLLVLILGRRITLRNRVLLKESLGGVSLDSALGLARKITLFALAAELAGCLILTARFSRDVDWPIALWMGLFHAVAAFTNAGFDLVGGFRSLTPYNHEPVVILTHAVLIILGGISYTVVEDLARTRQIARLTLDSKLVLVTTAMLLALGTLGFALTERLNATTLGAMDVGAGLLNAFFLAVAARTAGFNAVDIGALSGGALLLMIGLMFIGGAAGSTAGGIKVQTFSLLFFAIISGFRGKDEVEAFQRRIPTVDVFRALAVALLAIAVVFTGAFALSLSERFTFDRELFEVASAFGTVGLTTGITPDTTLLGRIILIVMMFVGRLGPLTLALALMTRTGSQPYSWPHERIKIG
jgi:trk system potassium uptake protein